MVAILSGEKQENSSLLIVATSALGYLQFPLIELAVRNGKEGASLAILSGAALLGFSWFVLLKSNIYFYLDAANANSPQDRPNYLYALLLSQWFTAVLLLSMQSKQVFTRTVSPNYAKLEFQYLSVSALSKLSFAGLVYWALCAKKSGC